jgi:hypothetical protein
MRHQLDSTQIHDLKARAAAAEAEDANGDTGACTQDDLTIADAVKNNSLQNQYEWHTYARGTSV